MHVVLGLLGVRVGELHGSLTQAQVPITWRGLLCNILGSVYSANNVNR